MSNQEYNVDDDMIALWSKSVDSADEDRRDVCLAVGIAIESFVRAIESAWSGE